MEIEIYLQSKDKRYYVPDTNIENAKIVIFECYPTAMDLKSGTSVSALKTWNGVEVFDGGYAANNFDIGTVYISNVPLYSTDEHTRELMGAFEGIRLPRYTMNQIKKFEACYNHFRSAFDSIIK